MLKNKPTKIKKISQEGLIYALIFLLYSAVLILVFVYAVKFLQNNLNLALSSPVGDEIEAKYGQLDLENYSVVAKKLNLTKYTTNNEVVNLAPVVASTSIAIATTSLPEIISSTTTTAEVISQVVPVLTVTENKPKITVINSTLKSGLAATLKNDLSAAGYEVLNTSNVRPSLAITTIRVKSSIDPNSKYLTEIKKIVSANYEIVILPLDDKATADIEVIIGNK